MTGAVLADVEPVEIPDLYLKISGNGPGMPGPYSGSVVPQDPQVVRFRAGEGAEVLAETIDRGHRANLGPAVVRKGRVIYIGSGLEAIYNEARIGDVRKYLATVIDPLLAEHRTYEVPHRAGLIPHLAASHNTLLLHLLADTGNKTKKLRIREEFTAMENVKVRVRVAAGRSVRGVSLLRAGAKLSAAPRDGWIEVTVPRVMVHEAIRVDLA